MMAKRVSRTRLMPRLMMTMTNIFFCMQGVNSIKNPLVPALYIMGDSLLDSGNNNFLPTLANAAFPPYGNNFAGGATGRFTNGRTTADFIAEYLGLPFPPPYLSLGRSGRRTGLNYASGACGILPETGNYIGKCLNIVEQIDLFQRTVEQELPNQYQSAAEISDHISKSIFLIATGNNDYLNNFLNNALYDTSKRYSPQSFATLLNDKLSLQFQRLYKLGARKVITFEIGPMGCIPSISRKSKHNRTCNEEINQLVNYFNDRLAITLRNLTSTLQDSAFILGHAHSLAYDAVVHPSLYGLNDSANPCCITWGNGTSACIPGLPACKDPNKHYFWDGYHLTEAVYRVIAMKCIYNSSVCLPKTIQELVRR